MQFTAQELKDKLLRALDAESNVVDHPRVVEVITTLERFTITKAQLEQTRLGKCVNDLRKKTKDKDLARRAKNLIRKWHNFISPSNAHAGAAAVNGSGGNGEHSSLPPHLRGPHGSKPASPASGPPTPSSGKSSLSPSSSQPGTPLSGLHTSRLSPRLPSHKPASPLVTPSAAASHHGNGSRHSPPGRPEATSTVTTCEVARPATPSETVSKVNVANKRKRRAADDPSAKLGKSPALADGADGHPHHRWNNNNSSDSKHLVNGDFHHRAKGPGEDSDRPGTVSTPLYRHGAPGSKCETPSLQERRHAALGTRTDLLARLDSPPPDSLDRSLSSSSSPAVRTPKVKTTAQLIEELHSKGGMRLSGSETVTKIAMNQIEKEADVLDPVVPPEAKPRYRRKPGTSAFAVPPPSTDKSLSKTKTEMVQKFLQSSALTGHESVAPTATTAGPPSSENLIQLIEKDDQRVETLVANEPKPPSPPPPPPSSPPEPEPDPASLLPPLDLDSIDLEEPPYEVPEPTPAGPMEVDKLETEHWPGVNGQLDHECNWQSWTTTYSTPSGNSETLHILPYVCLDD